MLAKIFESKREEVASAKLSLPLADVRGAAAGAAPVRDFQAAILGFEGTALIAEVKKASPSQGLIREDFDAAEIARTYCRSGAQALSVLTDGPFFQGSASDLRRVRGAVDLPLLRKDFIADPYQIYEARAWGADAILLIAAALGEAELQDLKHLATELGMATLLEVHSESEAEIALEVGAKLVGVNNRDLTTFKTDLSISDALIPKLAPFATVVSESAISSKADVDRVTAAGARAVLIGTTFCRASDIEAKVHEVMGR